MNPTCSSARRAAARHEGMACRMRLTLPLSLVPIILFAALSPGTYARDPNPTSHPCLARPGWWLGPDGSRLFQVAETGTAIVRGGLPPTACGVVPLQGLAITGLPCMARSEVPCASRVEIFFVTSELAVVSAQLIHDGGLACSDTCLAWDAVPAYADTSVGVSLTPWSGIKTMYR